MEIFCTSCENCLLTIIKNTTAFINILFFITELKTIIYEGSELYLKKGSDINLTCLINYTPESTSNYMVIWQHNNNIINFDSHGRGVKIFNKEVLTRSFNENISHNQTKAKSGDKSLSSTLLINSAQSSDSGNYSCHLSSSWLPSHNSKVAFIRVHVMNGGENPAAMQGGASSGHFLASSSKYNIISWLIIKITRISITLPVVTVISCYK